MTRVPAVSMIDVPNLVKKHLAWWPDWEFTNDLLLRYNRPTITSETVTATEALGSSETVLEISFQIENQTKETLTNLHVAAIIQDDYGMIMNRSETRLTAPLKPLAAQAAQPARIYWQNDCAPQCYHVLLILEDQFGNMVDVVSGEFTLA